MDCPPGLEDTSSDCVDETDALKLNSCIYGLVQAARQYYKKFTKILKRIGFTGGEVEPCSFFRRDEDGIVFIAVYVDYNLIVGSPKAVNKTIDQLKRQGLVLKIEEDLKDYLSCEIRFSKDQRKAWLGQPHLIKNLEKKFGHLVGKLREYKTPGTPNWNAVKTENFSDLISQEQQVLYRSGVGMLLYLVKHSRPDIANPVCELAKVLNGANLAQYKEMLRLCKFVLDTKTLGLKMVPTLGEDKEPWDLECFSDSDYTGDPDSRRSVSGFILYVRGVPISWRSNGQRSVTLSSTEAEWVAFSDAVKEIMFVMQLLESLKLSVAIPIVVRVDNIGAKFMAENVTTTSRTKHVDIRYKFVNEYVEDGIIKIIFVRSQNNTSDIMTKNLGGDLYTKHAGGLVGEVSVVE
jgi:hypothetical protein